MLKFAVYYIPEQEDGFYQLGTNILGYDIRKCQAVTMPSHLQSQFGQFDSSWNMHSQLYGLHLTINDALDCNWATLPQIERELVNLLACFDPSHRFTLQRCDDTPVEIRGEPRDQRLVLLYEPNKYLSMLHTLIVARINPLGIGSAYLQRYLTHLQDMQPHRAQQIRLFYSSKVLDNWSPHFTLLHPYTGDEPIHIASVLAELFHPYKLLTIRSVCLLIQLEDNTHWQIYREFQLPLQSVP